MLIWYSIRSYEVLYHKIDEAGKNEVFDVFYRVGRRMGLEGLPLSYKEWQAAHPEHIEKDTICGHFTDDLYRQYRKHLGAPRFFLLKKVQALLAPEPVKHMLQLEDPGILHLLLGLFKLCRLLRLDRPLAESLPPAQYTAQLRNIRLNSL